MVTFGNIYDIYSNTSVAAKGALTHRLQRLENPKWPLVGTKMTNEVYPQIFGHSEQLLLDRFFYASTPSMRKGRDGENKGEKWKKKK